MPENCWWPFMTWNDLAIWRGVTGRNIPIRGVKLPVNRCLSVSNGFRPREAPFNFLPLTYNGEVAKLSWPWVTDIKVARWADWSLVYWPGVSQIAAVQNTWPPATTAPGRCTGRAWASSTLKTSTPTSARTASTALQDWIAAQTWSNPWTPGTICMTTGARVSEKLADQQGVDEHCVSY